MKPPSHPADPPDDFTTPNVDADGEPDSVPFGQRLATWLKHFALYLSAVAAACIFGLYFLWRIPLPQEASQLFKSVGDSPRPRPLSSIVAPSSSSAKPQIATPLAATAPVASSPNPAVDSNAAPDGSAITPPPLAETPAEEVGPPTPQTQIEQLLTEAQQQMESRRLTAPASGNALNSYRRILELEADNPAALEGIERIAAYYRDIAEQTRQQGRFEESLAYVGRGLQASPKNESLLNLRQEVRLARQREQAQRQALAEAARRQQVERERDEQNQQRRQPVPSAQQPWWQQPAAPSGDSGFNQR
jgi:hypothetical protein